MIFQIRGLEIKKYISEQIYNRNMYMYLLFGENFPSLWVKNNTALKMVTCHPRIFAYLGVGVN